MPKAPCVTAACGRTVITAVIRMEAADPEIPPQHTHEFLALSWRSIAYSDVVVIRLTGELNLANAPDVDAALRHVQASSDIEILLDLSGLHYIDAGARHIIEQRRDTDRFRFVGDQGLISPRPEHP